MCIIKKKKNVINFFFRYNCSFEVKVRNAQAAGYDCAIVRNVNSSDLGEYFTLRACLK